MTKIGNSIWHCLAALGVLAGFGIAHWSYFFPLQTHSDLRFQSIGESLALFLSFVSFACLMIVFRRPSSSAPAEGRKSPKQILLFIVTIQLISNLIGWRDFFPNDQFCFSAGAASLMGSVIIGFIGFVLLNAFERRKGEGMARKDEGAAVI